MARHLQHGSPSSAAQPALASDGAAQPSSLPSGAAQPTLVSDVTPFATGTKSTLNRHCVQCGRKTASFCDGKKGEGCPADKWRSDQKWEHGQQTPYCTVCQKEHNSCPACRKVLGCMPFPFDDGPDGEMHISEEGLLLLLNKLDHQNNGERRSEP